MKTPTLVVAMLVAAASSQAATLSISLDDLISGSPPGAGSPRGAVTLADNLGVVTATYAFTGGSSGEFVTGFFLNRDKAFTATYRTPFVANFTGLDVDPTPLGGVSFG